MPDLTATHDSSAIPENFPCNLNVSCRSFTDSGRGEWAGRITQMSTDGLRLVLDRRFECGTVLRIQNRGSGSDRRGLMVARVHQLTPLSGGKWALDCRFSTSLQEIDLEEYLQGQDE